MKLYTLVRRDLKSHGVRAVQAAHSVAEYLLKNPNTNWDNGTMVLVKVEDEEHLKEYFEHLTKRNINYVAFQEPDMDNQYTALTAESDNGIPFCGLQLL
jgi:hypothetical protein